MEGGLAVGVDAQKLEKPLPEVGCEDWITIADEAGRQTVKSDDVLEEKGCHVRGRHGFCSRNEDCLFCQAVDDNEDCVVVVGGR